LTLRKGVADEGRCSGEVRKNTLIVTVEQREMQRTQRESGREVGGKVGAFLITEMMWVIPRLASWTTSLAVARLVRYIHGATVSCWLLCWQVYS
jgi:hypothetical protein